MYYTYLNIKYPFLRACKNRNNFRRIKPSHINFTHTFNILHFRHEKPVWNVSFTDEIIALLRQFFCFILYLNIYTCFFSKAKAQVLYLNIEAEKTISEELKDSLQLTVKSYKNYASLKKEADSIPIRLQRSGFIDCYIEELTKQDDSNYVARYFFGKRYRSINVYYSEGDFTKRELSKVSSKVTDNYFTLPFETAEASLQELNTIKTENGNAFAKLSLTNIAKETNQKLKARLILVKGEKRTIDSIVLKGYEKFPKSYIKYYAGVKNGKTFNQKKLVSQNEAVNNLPFARTLKAPEALFRKDSTIVYFYLEKRNANLFDGVLGFSTSEESNKLELNGYLNFELNNNLNFGEQLLINYKADGDEQRNFRTKIKLPYLLKSPFGIEMELKIFKRDSTFITTDQQARATYQVDPNSNTYIGYKGYESNNLLDEAIVGSPIEDFKSKFILAGGSYSKLQRNGLFPIKSHIALNTEIGSRDLKDSKDDQIKILTLVNHIFNLNLKNSIFIQNDTRVLFSDSYLANELFRFGGINSIRGFNENSIDASLSTVFNTEYRYQFNQGLYIHSIIDIGYFENETVSLKEKLYSYGIGIGLETKAGLLKLNIANGNSENQSFNFSNTKIHLTLSSRF